MRIEPLAGPEFKVDSREVELLEDLFSQIGKSPSQLAKHLRGQHDQLTHGNRGTLFHGTRYKVEEIRAAGELRGQSMGESARGVHLTSSREVAERFASDLVDGEFKVLGEVFEFTDLDLGRVLDRDTVAGETIFREIENEAFARGGRDEINTILTERGYDSISFTSPSESQPEITILSSVPIQKGDEHDQSTHGNWARGMVGSDRLPDDQIEGFKELRSKLLEIGGEKVVVPMTGEDDLEKLLERGELMRPDDFGTFEVVEGEPIACHSNSCRVREGIPDSWIVTGYALSKDDLWRQHTWVVAADDTLIETTIARKAYFGVFLEGEEEATFIDLNKNYSGIEKAGLPPHFGDAKKRRAQLVSRLKVRRRYKPPVKGGRKKKRRKNLLGGSLLRGRKATSLGGVSKHAGPGDHPSGSPQSVHGGDGASGVKTYQLLRFERTASTPSDPDFAELGYGDFPRSKTIRVPGVVVEAATEKEAKAIFRRDYKAKFGGAIPPFGLEEVTPEGDK